ncbi:MAG TPA: SurA N-terminal domain-containing protein, partial [Bacteroidales bacterium]
MATLERIRSKAGIIVAAVIGLALLGFILQDFFDSRKSLFRSGSNDVGKIAGEKIPVQRLQETENELTENYKLLYNQPNIDERMQDQIREQAWQQIINEEVMDKEVKKVGLSVSSDELLGFFLGSNPHPFIKQMFTNPQTGEFNKAMVQEFLNKTNDDQVITDETLKKDRQIRLYLEKEFTNQRLNTKYNNLIVKGLYAPKFMLKNEFEENNKKVDFNYIVQRYTSISDSAIKITASDLKDYYNDHKYLYDQVASRDVEYVTFDIAPSPADREAVIEEINKIKPEFVAAKDVEDYVRQFNAYNDKAYKQSDLPDSVGAFMFKASVGDVYGPYFDNGSYKLARLYKVVNEPDSVKSRHILIVPQGKAKEDVDKAKALADSLQNVIEKNKKADFAALAKQYSKDPGSAEKGGDIGWINENSSIVKPYKDFVFEGKKDEVKVVESQFGYHVIQITDRSKDVKKVKVAFVELKLDPSKTTYDKIYGDALRFASQNRTYEQFNAAIAKQNLIKRVASNIGENDKAIEGLEDARPVVKWAYKSEKSQISEPFTIGDRYVVAALTGVREKGTAPLDQVRSRVEFEVKKLKKAEKLTENIKKAETGARTIQDLALKLNTPV